MTVQLSLFEHTVSTLKIDMRREVTFDDYSKVSRLLIGLTEDEINEVVSSENLPLFMRRGAKMIKDIDKNPKLYEVLLDRAYGKPRTMPESIPPPQNDAILEKLNKIISETTDPQLLSNLANYINQNNSHD